MDIAGSELRPEHIVAAFTEKVPTSTQVKMIRVLLSNPGANAPFLSQLMGWPSRSNTFSMQFGKMARSRSEFLPPPLPSKLGADRDMFILILADIDPENGGFTMRPEAVAGFAMLGITAD